MKLPPTEAPPGCSDSLRPRLQPANQTSCQLPRGFLKFLLFLLVFLAWRFGRGCCFC